MSPSTKSLPAAGSSPLRVVLLACWGIGLALLDALMGDDRVQVVSVLTREARDDDPWAGAVMNRAQSVKLPAGSFETMGIQELCKVLDDSRADLLLVHAYPKKLPREVFDRPPIGTLNLHPSLLPKYRGAAPTRSALADKVGQVGLTTHVMDEGLDTGPIVSQRSIRVTKNDTVTTLIERMKPAVAPLMRETLDRILDPDFEPTPQDLLS